MSVKRWNRGQLVVFFGALLLCEGFLAWKYHDLEARYQANAEAMGLAYRMILLDEASGRRDDSLRLTLARGLQEIRVEGPRNYQAKRLILFLGGLVIPAVALAVAWVWVSGKPRTG
jgi:hypothetical protein